MPARLGNFLIFVVLTIIYYRTLSVVLFCNKTTRNSRTFERYQRRIKKIKQLTRIEI